MEEEKKKRGGQIKALYSDGKWKQRLVKIPDHDSFKEFAKDHGYSVVELSYIILKDKFKELKEADERSKRRLASTNELSKDNSRNSN